MKKIFLYLLSALLFLPSVAAAVNAAPDAGTAAATADGVNVTRWADLLIVYKDVSTTDQNEWGCNAVVNSDGIVTRIIGVGDTSGKNLAVPDGGLVVSANGARVEWIVQNISVGDYVRFDEVTNRVMVSKTDDFDISFCETLKITAFNSVRYADYTVIYDRAGTTGTNGYGYEVCVDSNGIVVSAGGNDNTVPDGGYVVSVVGVEKKLFLKTYGAVGASCEISSDRKSVTFTYDDEAIKRSVQMEFDELKSDYKQAKLSCKLIDYEAAASMIAAAEKYSDENVITTLAGRTELYRLIEAAKLALTEQKYVETRGVWYVPLETDLEGVQKTVAKLAEGGINQLCLGITSGRGTIIPLPDGYTYSQVASLRGFDLLGAYCDECSKAGIELVVSVCVFRNNNASYDEEWLTKANTDTGGESTTFYSPACDEYFDVFLKYITYILDNYAIDGLQLDYVRYPYYDGTTDYGYDETTKALFAAEYGVDDSVVDEIGVKLSSHAMWNNWIEFKASLVTKRVDQIRELVNEKRPDIYLSACLAADYTLQYYCQDGKGWIEGKLIDAVYPMSYAEGIMASQTEHFSSFDGEYYNIEGSGSYLSLSKAEQLLQVMQTREYDADGICFFELGAYFSHGYSDYLQSSAFYKNAVSPTFDSAAAAQRCFDSAADRIQLALSFGYITVSEANAFSDAAKAYNGSASAVCLELLSEYESTQWYALVAADLAFADKISALSKDGYEFTPPESGDESDTESEADTSGAMSSAESTPNDEPGSRAWLWAAGALLLAAAGCAVFLIIKKKKK